MKWVGSLGISVICLGLAWAQAPVPQGTHTQGPRAVGSFDRISKEADSARQAGRIDDAIALYKRGVALRPSWEEGWWFLGSLYYDQDNYEAGRDAFRRLTAINSQVGLTWAMLGLCEYNLRQYEPALAHLGHGISLGLSDSQEIADVARYHVALLLVRSGEFELALKELTEFSRRGLDQPKYVEAVGLAALRKPLLPEELPPSDRALVLEAGRAMFDAMARRVKDAESDFRLLLDRFPNTPNIHYLYGSFLLNEDAERALAEMKKELEVSPNHVPALVAIAAELLRGQEYRGALPYAEKAVETDVNSFAAHAILGRALVEGDIDKLRGVKELETARTLQPLSPQVRLALGTAYAKVGRNADAARERQIAQTMRKTDAGAPEGKR